MQTKLLSKSGVPLAVIGATLSLSSCIDPVHNEAIDALGPERRGVREGPNHRPGQPCRTCHGGRGPASPEFSIAGTVYTTRGVLEPIAGVLVVVTDTTGASRNVLTNQVGNFYIGAESWSPTFPVKVTLQDSRAEENGEKVMKTPIGRTGDCASCHRGVSDELTNMPAVYLRERPSQ